MKSIIILLSMIACLFGPTIVFTIFGYRSMVILARRPPNSAGVMIALIVRLVLVSAVLIGILMFLLKSFAPVSSH